MDYALPWDQIPPSMYETWNIKPFNLKSIQEKSKARVEKNETFTRINSNAEYLKFKQNNTSYSLNLKTYQADQLTTKKEEESFKKEDKEITDWNFTSLKADLPSQADPTVAARTATYIKALQKDATIYEAVQVIRDIRK